MAGLFGCGGTNIVQEIRNVSGKTVEQMTAN
jgi:hypothetical protein